MPQLVGRLTGQFRAPLQLHRGLDRLDALASRSNRLTERSPEPLIGFDQLFIPIRRGKRRLCHQLVLLPDAEVVIPTHCLKCSHSVKDVQPVRLLVDLMGPACGCLGNLLNCFLPLLSG